MSQRREKIWPLKPHSLGKHLVLREYLQAWLPILGQTEERILFLDGFAGPGEYKGGEEGSPIIALKAFLEHSARNQISAEVKFVFIEKKERRAENLRRLVQPLEERLPRGSEVQTICGAFDETVARQLDALTHVGKTLAPCFAMVDPFGLRDTPMDVLARILTHPKSEIFISVMYEFSNRFPYELRRSLDSLYGCKDWREHTDIADPDERRRHLFCLYKRQLKKAGAEQVIHFDLYDGGRHKYSIFHASRHPRASNEMKVAIWKVDPGGGFVFHGGQTEQLELGVEPDFRPLREALRNQFRGPRWSTIDQIERFVMSDKTDYHKSQLRDYALEPMEDAGEVEVLRAPSEEQAQQPALPGLNMDAALPRKKKRKYPRGTRLRFT
ncbi:MAG: three-Cys-motif partner protein TcmP [Gemmatimonadetes bacterium]|nr:three-Cys-motif partner protein TcmP [Gemmatimonadota bacterium]